MRRPIRRKVSEFSKFKSLESVLKFLIFQYNKTTKMQHDICAHGKITSITIITIHFSGVDTAVGPLSVCLCAFGKLVHLDPI